MIRHVGWLLILTGFLRVPASGRISIRMAYYRETNWSIHLLLKNESRESVRIPAPIVNGFDTSLLDRSASRKRDVLWYRCRPNPIPAGGMADMTIILPKAQDGRVSVELAMPGLERLRCTVKCQRETIRFQAVRFGSDLRTIYAYLQSDASITRLKLDGRDVRRYAHPWPIKTAEGFGFVRIVLPQALVKGSFHIVEAESTRGKTFCQVRVIPAQFLIGVYGSVSPENIRDWAKHGCNHYLSFGWVKPDDVVLMGQHGIKVGLKAIPEPLVDRAVGEVVAFDETVARGRIMEASTQPAFLYHHLVDEPDVADYYAGRWLGSSSMELVARAEFCERIDPEHYTFVQLDNTFHPNNYKVYGEIADVLATHRYSLGNYLRSEAGQESVSRPPFLEDLLTNLERFRGAVEPRQFYVVTQFFNLGRGRQGRPPTINEMRLQCYAMIGEGASGVIHYIHSGSTGGGEGGRSKQLWDAMIKLHEELRRIGEIVAIAAPAPRSWVTTSTPNVLARLLVADRHMVLVLINRAHRSALDGFTVHPIRDVTVTFRIPPWMDSRRLTAVSVEGGLSIPLEVSARESKFQVGEIIDARCLIIGAIGGQ